MMADNSLDISKKIKDLMKLKKQKEQELRNIEMALRKLIQR
jgi:hypothetical protein